MSEFKNITVEDATSAHYQAYHDELLQRPIKTAMRCDLSSETTRGDLESAP